MRKITVNIAESRTGRDITIRCEGDMVGILSILDHEGQASVKWWSDGSDEDTVLFENPVAFNAREHAEETGQAPPEPEGVEIFEAAVLVCGECGAQYPDYSGSVCGDDPACVNVNCDGTLAPKDPPEDTWWWWSCQPGCLPDGDPNGPFSTEAEAREDYNAQG